MVPKPPHKPYSSDLTDAQWKLLEPLLPSAPGGGRPVTTDRREVVKVILSGDKNGCAWRALPHAFPPEGTVRDSFHRGRRAGVWERLLDTLRQQV
jgi:putative transposase